MGSKTGVHFSSLTGAAEQHVEDLAVIAVAQHESARDPRTSGPSSTSRGPCVIARNHFAKLYMARNDWTDGARATVVAWARQTPYWRFGVTRVSRLAWTARSDV